MRRRIPTFSVLTRKWRPAIALLAVLLALVPFSTHSALESTRLDWGGKAPMPTPRHSLGVAAAANGKLYAVGGPATSFPLPTVEEYDPATNSWSAKLSLASSRGSLGLAAHANGKLYAIGGLVTSDGSTVSTGIVEEYDPATSTRATKAPLLFKRFDLAVAANLNNGKLYAVGGRDGGTPLPTLEEYDPTTNVWTRKKDMSFGRSGLALVATRNGMLYAVGGNATAANCPPTGRCSTVEEYNPFTDTWTPKPALSVARSNFGLAVAPNGKLYAIGGVASSTLAAVEEYDPATNTPWTSKAPMPTARQLLGLATAPNGKMYAVGGFNSAAAPGGCGGTCAVVEEYDPVANVWSTPFAPSTVNYPQRYQPAVVSANNRVYVFGGDDLAGNYSNETWEYTPATDLWRRVADMPTRRRGAAAALATNGRIYVVGGRNTSGILNTFEEFIPPIDGVGQGSWTSRPVLPHAVTVPGAAAGSNGRVYVVGGYGGVGELPQEETFEYNPATNGWTPVAPMLNALDALGVAVVTVGGQERLYAVGGEQYIGGGDLGTVDQTQMLVLPSAGSPTSAWTSAGLARLPELRAGLALVTAPNGKLYAIGGSSTQTGSPTPKADVYEYDPVANVWSSGTNQLVRARLATPREYHGAAIVGQRLFVLGGNAGAAQSFEAANLTQLPSVSAGGPYSAPTGGSATLSATGSDPEGGALEYAWDFDGDFLYETPGQNPTVSTAGLAGGTRTVRVRATDRFGAYAVASTTLAITGAAGLQFGTQPGDGVVGQPLAPQPVVQVVDASGAVVPAYTGPVTVTFGTNAGAGVLGGTTTVNAVNGVATFTNLFVNAAGNGYTLIASSGGLTTATSVPFDVTAAPPPPPPSPCSPRPNVRVTTTVASPGVLKAAVASQISPALPVNSLNAIRLTRVTNATVLVNGTPVVDGASVPLPSASTQAVLTVQRAAAGAVHVGFVVTDVCGEWPSFVGGGPSSF